MSNSPDRIVLISLSLGTAFLLGSNVMGHGVGIAPDLRGGLLLAAAGLLFFVLAESRLSSWKDRGLRLLRLLLAMGTFSVVAYLIVADLQEFHHIAATDWGAIPPPQMVFSTIYALASLSALLGISVNARRERTAVMAVQVAAD